MLSVIGGVWNGQPLRKARKAGRCDYFRGALNGGRCRNTIEVGQYYMQGEANDAAGCWGNDRYCMDCAGPEARASLAAALAEGA